MRRIPRGATALPAATLPAGGLLALAARCAAVLLAGGLLALAAPAPASAHAYLARSAPADGAVQDRAPEVLALSFTEHVELSAARVTIVDGDGRGWAITSLALRPTDGASSAASAVSGVESPVTLVAGLPHLPANTYHVFWHTLSSDDLHATSGTLVFGVQRAVDAAAAVPGPSGPGARESILRAMALTGLATLLGGAALALMQAALARRRAGGSAPGPALRRRLLRVGAVGGSIALLATPAQLLVQVSADGGRWRGLLLHQLTTGRWLMREVGLAMLVAAVLWAARGWRAGRAPAVLTLGAAGALLAAAGTALLGHPMGGAPATVLIGAVHVLAAGGWAGGVLVAALVALMPGGSVGQVRELLRAFAALAVTCVAALTVTGLLMTGAQVSTVDALLTTPYGLILLAKVTAVAAAGLLGLRTARRLRRSDGGLLPRAGLLVEAAALAAVLALAGTLAASGPARGPRFPVATPVTAQPQVSGQAADLLDTLRIRPNRPGRNVLTITVSDTRRPAPAPISGVSVSLAGPDGARRVHPVTRTPEGWTVTLDEIRTPGEWQVAVTVMRDGLAPVTDTHRWAVPAAPATVTVSAAPLQPAIGVLAALVAFGAVAASIVYGRRRWRRRGTAVAERRPAVSAEESERVPIEV